MSRVSVMFSNSKLHLQPYFMPPHAYVTPDSGNKALLPTCSFMIPAPKLLSQEVYDGTIQ